MASAEKAVDAVVVALAATTLFGEWLATAEQIMHVAVAALTAILLILRLYRMWHNRKEKARFIDPG